MGYITEEEQEDYVEEDEDDCDCEECNSYDEDEEDDEPDDYRVRFPICPTCGSDFEYVGTSDVAQCDRGHKWRDVA